MLVYRCEVFDNTLRQDMIFFDHPDNNVGGLVSRLSSEPTCLQELISVNIGLIVINMVNVLSSSILAIVVGWQLGLALSLGALPVLLAAGYMRIRLEYKFVDDTTALFAKSSGVASEAAMAIRTVSSLALERAIIERYDASLQGIAQRAIGSLGWKMFFYSLSQSLSFLAMALGFWYAAPVIPVALLRSLTEAGTAVASYQLASILPASAIPSSLPSSSLRKLLLCCSNTRRASPRPRQP
jgi:ATP-binding cassette, subfamily B (MDR/TAP), member 1